MKTFQVKSIILHFIPLGKQSEPSMAHFAQPREFKGSEYPFESNSGLMNFTILTKKTQLPK